MLQARKKAQFTCVSNKLHEVGGIAFHPFRLLRRLSSFTLVTKCVLFLRRTSSEFPSRVLIKCWTFDSQSLSRIDCSSREVQVIDGQCVHLKIISSTHDEQIARCSNCSRLMNFGNSTRSEISHV